MGGEERGGECVKSMMRFSVPQRLSNAAEGSVRISTGSETQSSGNATESGGTGPRRLLEGRDWWRSSPRRG